MWKEEEEEEEERRRKMVVDVGGTGLVTGACPLEHHGERSPQARQYVPYARELR